MKATQPKEMQIVDINEATVPCVICGSNLIDITNFMYDGQTTSTATYREERCKCKQCGTLFILHYNLFDENGHVYSKVFTEDINNPTYNWQDALTEEQKAKISEHLQHCEICVDRLSHEILTDAWLKGFINDLRKNDVKL
jgi:transcription elongation factor Elf1